MRDRNQLARSLPRASIEDALRERELRWRRLCRSGLIVFLLLAAAIVAFTAAFAWRYAETESVIAKIRSNRIPCSCSIRQSRIAPNWIVDPVRNWLPPAIGRRLVWRKIYSITIRDRASIALLADALRPLDRLERFKIRDISMVDSATHNALGELLETVAVDRLIFERIVFTDQEMARFKSSNIRRLDVRKCDVTHATVLSFPVSLEYVDVEQTNISDESLSAFATFENLKTLSLNGIGSSEAALQRLRGEMPWCNVRWTHALQPLEM